MDKRKIKKGILVFTLTKIPLLIYLVWAAFFVPAVNALDVNYIQGAHRGASEDYTENTLEAFESAVQNDKYKFIEFDLTQTKDKKIAVIHQNSRYLMPKKGAVVRNLEYEELLKKFEYKIPQYNEVMDIVAGKKPLNIEIKAHGDLEAGKEMVDFVIDDCKQRGIENEIMISSPSEGIVQYIEKNYSQVETGRVYWLEFSSIMPLKSTTKEFYNDSQADYLILHGNNLFNAENLLKLKPENKTLIFWYFTDEAYVLKEENSEGFWD